MYNLGTIGVLRDLKFNIIEISLSNCIYGAKGPAINYKPRAGLHLRVMNFFSKSFFLEGAKFSSKFLGAARKISTPGKLFIAILGGMIFLTGFMGMGSGNFYDDLRASMTIFCII